jgi:preprotein translocase SecF subunit
LRPLLRLVPDDTKIKFMRGRFLGVITSAILSIASVILFFHPGLNYTIDFKGGVLTELKFATPVDAGDLRKAFATLDLGDPTVQQFGAANEALVKLPVTAPSETIRPRIQGVLDKDFPGGEIRRLETVGARVSSELSTAGLTATGLALLGILAWIWFRFDWQFGVALVLTLILDATKTVGFYAATRLPFDQDSLAALLILIGFSVTDKVVVFDRIRENLRKFKSKPLREVVDLSINQTLSRTIATSMTVLLSILPLALIARGSVQFFAITMVFGIVVGTTSSIFIASPILLFLGEKRLRPGIAPPTGAAAEA